MHNAVLQAMIQTGIIGVALFVGAFLWAWILAIRLARQRISFSEEMRSLVIEAFATLTFFTFRSLLESTAAFYGVDLIMLAPVVAFLQVYSRQMARMVSPQQGDVVYDPTSIGRDAVTRG
jgi:O-antigen ligase